MGSSGNGRFGDYNNGSSTNGSASSGSGNGASGGIGSGNDNGCPRSIENISLDDVATSGYYIRHGSTPRPHTQVVIASSLYQGRIVVRTADNNEVVGNLPTNMNYLAKCIKILRYSGQVISSGESPIPYVVVSVRA